MPPSDDQVTYDWPEGGGAPFDAAADETRWVLVAGMRFGRTWPAGDRRDFGDWGDFEKRVPMGYKVIQLAERLAVVDRGTVVREWAGTSEAVDGPYAALDGNGSERGPDGHWISHEHDSYAGALAEARDMQDREVLVVSILQTVNWH
ncbi:hypothetical protein SAMN04489844_4108 [Nocardioides exalbidus]|uniref:Uncharacterized protein n=1 Tax=Nocardioides exalbidus TaxID=402596 RepID=A0A1H4ZG35_9ACTN|nr:hypothetical protein [Nocardioides exalbidus]SED29109.1 hypothetical protein SAMN04489844_4108 [Nocardioides exalbidus]